jgi:hypothetical protein
LGQLDAAVAILETVDDGARFVSPHLDEARRGLDALKARKPEDGTTEESGAASKPDGLLRECERLRSDLLREAAAVRREMGIQSALYKYRFAILGSVAAIVLLGYIGVSVAVGTFVPGRWFTVRIDGAYVVSATQSWGSLQKNRGVVQSTLRIGNVERKNGFGTHATSRIELGLEGSYSRVSGVCGLDDDTGAAGSVRCRIEAQGKTLFQSEVMTGKGTRFAPFSVPLEGATKLSLIVDDGGDGMNTDHAGWGDLKFE